jgi:hypothetical protein
MSDAATTPQRPGLVRAHHVVVLLLPLLVLVQATLAGQHLFAQPLLEGNAITVHGIIGNVTFALTVLGIVLTVVRKGDGLEFGLAVALLALCFAQVGLGYVGREELAAGAWHIPVGVAIFGLTCYQLALVRGARPGR